MNWQITGPSGGVKTTSGTVTFPENDFMKNIVVEITSDDVPELEAAYRLKIVSVDGGADIDPARNNLTFIIRYTSDALSGACMGPREIDGQCRLKFPFSVRPLVSLSPGICYIQPVRRDKAEMQKNLLLKGTP